MLVGFLSKCHFNVPYDFLNRENYQKTNTHDGVYYFYVS